MNLDKFIGLIAYKAKFGIPDDSLPAVNILVKAIDLLREQRNVLLDENFELSSAVNLDKEIIEELYGILNNGNDRK